MAAPTLNDLIGRDDPAPLWRYAVTMPDLSGLSAPGAPARRQELLSGMAVTNGITSKSSMTGTHTVENITFPHSNAPAKARFNAASNVYYPTFNDIEATTIEFFEDVNYSTLDYLLAWRHLVFDKDTGSYRESSIYKMNITLRAYPGVEGASHTFKGTLKGCWPTTVSPFVYSNDSNRLVVSCTFSVDSNDVSIIRSDKPSVGITSSGGGFSSAFA